VDRSKFVDRPKFMYHTQYEHTHITFYLPKLLDLNNEV